MATVQIGSGSQRHPELRAPRQLRPRKQPPLVVLQLYRVLQKRRARDDIAVELKFLLASDADGIQPSYLGQGTGGGGALEFFLALCDSSKRIN